MKNFGLVAAAGLLVLLPAAAFAFTADLVLEGLTLPLGEAGEIELRFGESKTISAMDEHGRRCLLKDGRLEAFTRGNETFWQLGGQTETGGLYCRNGMVFKIDPRTRRFVRHDHGFHEIFAYYARVACAVRKEEAADAWRALSERESRHLTDCYLKPDIWKSYLSLLKLARGEKGRDRHQACTTDLLKHENLRVACSNPFKKMADESAFNDVLVIMRGSHIIRGGGSDASNYILHPEFQGEIDLKGHGHVFHLRFQKCVSEDIFRGCIGIGAPPAQDSRPLQ